MECTTVGQRVSNAILLEASSIKVGNVHPLASFPDMTFGDFQKASVAIGRSFDATVPHGSLGSIVLGGVEAMLESVSVNTSLGTILLFAPMAMCLSWNGGWSPDAFGQRVSAVIGESTIEDSERIYEAIRIAKPGGLGRVETQDVRTGPPACILSAMQQASAWDDVALQYANGFQQILLWSDRLLELFESSPDRDAVRCLQMEILASRPDSLIVRKHGRELGRCVQDRAAEVLRSGPFGSPEYERQWELLDGYLREEPIRKNPGTTADLIAAAILLASYRRDRQDG